MARRQVNVRLPEQLIQDAKRRGGLTAIIEEALTNLLYGNPDTTEDRYDTLETRVSALEELAQRY